MKVFEKHIANRKKSNDEIIACFKKDNVNDKSVLIQSASQLEIKAYGGKFHSAVTDFFGFDVDIAVLLQERIDFT